ncbi:hypothetical protein GX51_02685 [Blastomyces parvus]|uniref:Uncharacterized protein n=1 Tax=Blastomyces parvus TaxID=2060905 RepID=A0A2B7X2N3_9EURO|nr:hypothetical protein GX51_02685 [Blastomyces parvus]
MTPTSNRPPAFRHHRVNLASAKTHGIFRQLPKNKNENSIANQADGPGLIEATRTLDETATIIKGNA